MRLAGTKWSAIGLTIAAVMSFGCGKLASAQQATPGVARVVGTIQSISGKSLTVLSDQGAAAPVTVEDATKFLQIEPGKTDLKEATPIAFGDLQLGDRVLVRGILADDGTTVRAASVIAVKKAALAEKQAKERAEWQRGVGGLVKSIDPTASTISLTTNGIATSKEVSVHFTKDTIFRRYATTPRDLTPPGWRRRRRSSRVTSCVRAARGAKAERSLPQRKSSPARFAASLAQ